MQATRPIAQAALRSCKLGIKARTRLLYRVWAWRTPTAATLLTGSLMVWATTLPVFTDAAAAPENTVIEPETRRSMPTKLLLPVNGKPETLELAGVGVRRVTFLRIAVYLAGVYLRPSDAGRSVSEIFNDPDAKVVIRISPVRDTNGAHLRRGLSQRLQSAIPECTASAESADEALQALDELRHALSQPQLRVGQNLDFCCSPTGLQVFLDGETVWTIPSRAFARAFVHAYLDRKSPVSPTLIADLAQRRKLVLSE